MLKTLVKKQLSEVFRSFFYNPKTNETRSSAGVVGKFVFFILLLFGILGTAFVSLSLSICAAFHEAGMGWFYFTLMSGIAVTLGTLGSVFNTYSGLYLAKDNDLLLSLPIPEKTIIASRLVNVYLLGVLYSSVVFLPAMVVYWITADHSVPVILCDILLFLIITLIILVLSCLLGWLVAKISLKVKKRSFVSVLVSLLFLGAYWFFYSKASDLIQDLVMNAAVYGERVKGAAYGLYLFGRIGEGYLPAALLFTAVTLAVTALTWRLLSRSFLSIATSSGKSEKVRYVEKRVKEKSVSHAFFSKELNKFTSSPNYMLNCGLGILLIPVCGAFLLIKGPSLANTLTEIMGELAGCIPVLASAAIMSLTSMIDTAAPSVSLEGKSLWIPQSLPVQPQTVLLSKAAMQAVLGGIPTLFAAVCAAAVIPGSAAVKAMTVILPLVYVVFYSLFSLYMGLKMPNLTWTSELVPIKQSGAVLIAMLGSIGIVVIFAGLFLLLAYPVGAFLYMTVFTLILAAASLVLFRYLKTKGAERFREL